MKTINFCYTRIFIKPLLAINQLVFGLLVAQGAVAFNEDALWLPSSYYTLTSKLILAAEKLESLPECEKVIRGSLHDSTTNEENAKFLFVCQTVDKRTFPVIAAAQTQEFTFPVPLKSKADEDDNLPENSTPIERLETRVASAWPICQEEYDRKTRYMIALTTLTKERPAPIVLPEGHISLQIDFDAQDMQGRPLSYSADCQFMPSPESEVELIIRARR